MPLPEIILSKMLVKNSFHSSRSGFAFELKNNFAPGTITSLKLVADNETITPARIRFQVEGQPLTPASAISMETPAAFPTGRLVTVSAEHPHPISSLVLQAETKEAGTLQITIYKPSHTAKNEPSWFSTLRKPESLNVPLITGQSELDSSLLGVFCRGAKDFESQQRKAFSPPLLILQVQPGADGHHWGKSDAFSVSKLQEGRRSLSYRFPSNDKERMLPEASIEPKIIWMVRPQCAEDLDALVKHTDRAARRIFGSDAWQPWELSAESARGYAQKVNQFQKTIITENSTIPTIVMGKCLHSDDSLDANALWNRTLLETLEELPDVIYWQVPPLGEWLRSDEVFDLGWQGMSDRLIQMIERMEKQLTVVDETHRICQALDYSLLVSTLDCGIRNHQSDWQPVDLAFLLFTAFSACAEKSQHIAFSSLLSVPVDDLGKTPFSAAFELLSAHFGRTPSFQTQKVNYSGTFWNKDRLAAALMTTAEAGRKIDISAINTQFNRKLRINLPHDLKSDIRNAQVSSTQYVKGSEFRKKEFRISNASRFEVPPRSMAHWTISLGE